AGAELPGLRDGEVTIEVADRDARARRVQRLGRGEPDAARAARDRDDLAGEPGHQELSRAPGVNRTGIDSSELAQDERSRSTGPASSMSVRRRVTSSKITFSSRRASPDPRQKWRPPPPNALWLCSSRRMSKLCGSS